MKQLSKYNEQFIAKLNEQLAVYTTIGTPKVESPMWFQFKEVTDTHIKFASSQNNHMFFSLPLAEGDEELQHSYRHEDIYNYFKELKYSHIKEHWPTVYYELRPDEKPVETIDAGGYKQVKEDVPFKVEARQSEDSDSEYDIQAKKFLSDTKTELTTTFFKFGKHFQDDKHPRNIFEVTLKNERHEYTFKFGSSLADSLENCNDIMHEDFINFFCGFKFTGLKNSTLYYSDKIPVEKIKKAYEANNIPSLISKPKAMKEHAAFVDSNTNKYKKVVNVFDARIFIDKVTQSLVKKSIDLANKNFGEAKQAEKVIHPTAYSILAALTKYEAGTFEDFCGNYGYEEDSRKAYKIYEAVKDEWENICKLFTPEEIEQLQEIN